MKHFLIIWDFKSQLAVYLYTNIPNWGSVSVQSPFLRVTDMGYFSSSITLACLPWSFISILHYNVTLIFQHFLSFSELVMHWAYLCKFFYLPHLFSFLVSYAFVTATTQLFCKIIQLLLILFWLLPHSLSSHSSGSIVIFQYHLQISWVDVLVRRFFLPVWQTQGHMDDFSFLLLSSCKATQEIPLV